MILTKLAYERRGLRDLRTMLLLEHTPSCSFEAATALAEKLYGLSASATPLPGERDQNFLLATVNGEKFVLKIANALESRALLEAQHQALAHLALHVSFCPRVVPTISGNTFSEIESPSCSNILRQAS